MFNMFIPAASGNSAHHGGGGAIPDADGPLEQGRHDYVAGEAQAWAWQASAQSAHLHQEIAIQVSMTGRRYQWC